jgi:hypothetical protein
MSRRRSLAISALLLGVSAFSRQAGADIGLGALGIDPNSLISPDVIKSLVSFIGFGVQHRPYEPATPLGVSVGLDFSLEVTLFKVPDSLFSSLSAIGAPASSPLPSLPIPKIHLHKGFGDYVDIGGSILYLPSNWIVGGDVKIVLVQGEEGPTYAARLCYTYTDLSFNGISLTTHTISPQLLVSRQMEFADPYLGVALEYVTGSVNATLTIPSDIQGQIPAGITVPPYTYNSPVVTNYGAYAFGGVSLKIPRSGLRITIEGSYNTAGESTMGTKAGFTF